MNIFVLNMSGYASYTILQRRVFEVILTVDYNFDGKLSSSLPLSLITTYFLSHSTHILSHINYACLVPTFFSFDFGKSPLCPHLLFHFCIFSHFVLPHFSHSLSTLPLSIVKISTVIYFLFFISFLKIYFCALYLGCHLSQCLFLNYINL